MSAEVFRLRREAIRYARRYGFKWERGSSGADGQRRACFIHSPASGYFASTTDALSPYWYWAREQAAGDVMAISDAEREAFGLAADLKFVCILRTEGSTRLSLEYRATAEPETEKFTCDYCGETQDTGSERAVFRAVGYSVARRRTERRRTECWCENCSDRHASSYEGELFHKDDMVHIADMDACVPADVAQESFYNHSDGEWRSYPEEEPDDEDGADLYSYGSNVVQVHGWPSNTSREALCFGVELEVEPKDDSDDKDGQRMIVEALGGRTGENAAYILAADGSLGEGGVEIITVPQTLEAHKSGAVIPWRAMCKAIAKIAMSGQGTEACGMHVHINRKALTPLQLGKMLVFVNARGTRALLEKVAQRSHSQFAEMFPKKISHGAAIERGDIEASHYDALSVTGKGTVELRIFKGNTRYSRIMKNIEFTHALCTFCRDASVQDVSCAAPFMKWLAANARTYPELSKFLDATSEDEGVLCA